ncbi:MAG TPA: hypothetical protein VF053_00620 [Streptosporangiales bacterium]
MAQRVFLHVGAPKTGTTYLQQILWNNAEPLRGAGILLPGTRTAHYQAMGDLRRGLWHDPAGTWTWDRIAATARDWPGTVVVSEEMLGAATAEEAASAVRRLAPAEVHVVVAGRDLLRTVPSSWQQAIRARGVGRFGAYVAALRSGSYPQFWAHQTPLPILQRWGADLPAEQRHLVTVPPPGSDPGLLWARFAEVVGIPPGLCRPEVEDGNANTSLGAGETELLRRVNVALGDEYPLRAPYVEVVHRNLVSPVLMRRPRGGRFGIPAEHVDWFDAAGHRMVDELKAYPCHVVGDLDDLLPAEVPVSRSPGARSPDDVTDAELAQTAVETIVGMLRHAETLTAEGPGPGRRRRRLPAAVRSGVRRILAPLGKRAAP